MKHRQPVFCLIVAAGTLCGGQNVRAQTPLRWRFKTGEVLHYEYHVKNNAEVKSTGALDAVPKKSGVDLRLDLTWSVDRVGEDGTASITQKVDRARLSMFHEYAFRDEAAYDSSDRATVNNIWSGMMDAIIRPLLGEPYALKVNSRGRLTEVKLPEKTLKAWKALPFQPDDKADPFAPVFSKDGFSSVLAPVMPELPDQPVGAGRTWDYSWGFPGAPLRLVDTYSPVEPRGQANRFTAKTDVSWDRPTASPIAPPPPFGYPMSLVSQQKVELKTATIKRELGEATLERDQAGGHIVAFSRDLKYTLTSTYSVPGKPWESGEATGTFHLTAGMKLVPPRK